MTMLSVQFAEDIRSNTRINSDLLKSFQDEVTKVESQICPESMLLAQLQECSTSYGCLKERLENVHPALNQLNASTAALAATQDSLMLDMKTLREKLEEPQVPTSNPVLEMELSSKFAENTQLQLQIHDMSSEMDNLRKQLGEIRTQNQNLQQSFSESVSERQAAEEHNRHLEAEKLALKSEIDSAALKVQQEADAANSIAVKQLAAQHQNEIEALLKQKDDIENSAADIAAQLKTQYESQLATIQNENDDKKNASAKIAAEIKAEYEIKIGNLQKHKDDMGRASSDLTAQLSSVQECLVGIATSPTQSWLTLSRPMPKSSLMKSGPCENYWCVYSLSS